MSSELDRFRSGFERRVSRQLEKAGASFEYESLKVKYQWPPRDATYHPDFIIQTRSGKLLLIESKGLFVAKDRQKHLLVKAQRPDLDIRFLFMRSATKISKTSSTTYAAWCEKHGFKYADLVIPQEWLDE